MWQFVCSAGIVAAAFGALAGPGLGFVSEALAATDGPVTTTAVVLPASTTYKNAHKSPAQVKFTSSNPAITSLIAYTWSGPGGQPFDAGEANAGSNWMTPSAKKLTAAPGTVVNYTLFYHAETAGGFVESPFKRLEFRVYSQSTTDLRPPSVPSSTTTSRSTKFSGRVYGGRVDQVGRTDKILLRFYRWQKVGRTSKWVLLKSKWATITGPSSYSTSTKLTIRGRWSVIAVAPSDITHTADTSARSASFVVR